jgi:hypothetical protein
MGTTDHGLVYPTSGSPVQVPEDIQALAVSVEAALDAYEAWNSWTPVFPAGPTTIGAGGVSEGFYQRIDDLVFAQFRVELGTGFAFTGTTFELTLPVVAYDWGGSGNLATIGSWVVRDDSVPDHYAGSIGIHGPTSTSCDFPGAWDGTSPKKRVSSSAGIPITWAAGDIFSGLLQYRAA